MDLCHERENTGRVWRGGHMNNGREHSCYGVDLRLYSICMNRQKLRVCVAGGRRDRLRPNKELEVNPLKMYVLLKILDIPLL